MGRAAPSVLKLYIPAELHRKLADLGFHCTNIAAPGGAVFWRAPNKRHISVPPPEPGMATYSPDELKTIIKGAKQVARWDSKA